jgi:hypothetical protein
MIKIKYILSIITVLVLSGISLAHAQSDVFTQNLYYGLQNNSQVTQLQEFLTSQGLYSGPITGNFYFLTLGAVKAFQTQQGIIPAAGYFGPITMAAANKIADAEVGASNSQAILETGTSTPSAPPPASSTAQFQLQALMQKLALMEQQLQTIQGTSSTTAAQPAVSTPTSQVQQVTTPQPATTQSATSAQSGNTGSSYTTVDLDAYHENPAAYIGDNIVVLGVVDNFVPGSGGGGFVESYNPGDFTQPVPHVEMALSNEVDYTTAVKGLQLGTSSVILAQFYGTGAQSQTFTLTTGGQTVFPVVNITRINRCIQGNLSGMVVMGSSLSDISTCSEWKTIYPASMVGQISYTNTTPSTPQPSTNPISTPTASITANGSASSITIPYDTATTISWNSVNANSCNISPSGWSGTSGNQSTGNLTTSQRYTVSCYGVGGSVSAGVAINVSAQPTTTIATTSASTADSITQFSLLGITDNLCGSCQNFTVKVPLGTNLASLTPDIAISAGATISPASGVTQNFTNPITYTVMAGDGVTTKTYVATVLPTPNTDGILRGLTVNGAMISGFGGNTYNYNITLPAGTTVVPAVAATPDSSLSNVVITQARGLLGSATVMVTAQDGVTTETYTINFAVQPSYTVLATSSNSNSPESTSQCNVNGDVFTCTSNPNISVSLATPLTNTPSGISYVQPITINDPNTSSQNFRWNIIGNYLPPGIGFAFSPSQALECSGTSCFFATPPSGLSYPTNSPGEFFGTPTAAGNYSFSLQGIDDTNYFTLPSFDLNIVVQTPATTQ